MNDNLKIIQKLMASKNERKLFWRKCDLTNNNIISTIREDVDFPVYSVSEWWKNTHKIFSLDLNFEKPFFEQLAELSKFSPRPSQDIMYSTMDNSIYCNCANNLKDCYMVFEAMNSQSCFYSRGVVDSNDCYECYNINKCELSYELIDCFNCYHCFFLQDCRNCIDTYYSRDLTNCKNCFGCTNLINKENCFFNKQLTKEEYSTEFNRIIKKENKEILNLFLDFQNKQYKKDNYILFSENCSGEYIKYSKNVINSFDVEQGENLDNCFIMLPGDGGALNCSNIVEGFLRLENCHTSQAIGMNAYNVFYSDGVFGNVKDLYYCQQVVNGSYNCFGCISLIKAKNSILNKEYTMHEYEILKAKLINHMKETGEWEQYIPNSIFKYPYNDSLAQDYFPMTTTEIIENGFRYSIDNISFDASYDKCNMCEKNFKMIKQETNFYNNQNLNYPDQCFDCRHLSRMKKRRKFIQTYLNCSKCKQKTRSSIDTKILCRGCYEEEYL